MNNSIKIEKDSKEDNNIFQILKDIAKEENLVIYEYQNAKELLDDYNKENIK